MLSITKILQKNPATAPLNGPACTCGRHSMHAFLPSPTTRNGTSPRIPEVARLVALLVSCSVLKVFSHLKMNKGSLRLLLQKESSVLQVEWSSLESGLEPELLSTTQANGFNCGTTYAVATLRVKTRTFGAHSFRFCLPISGSMTTQENPCISRTAFLLYSDLKLDCSILLHV
jgi:hypothetical protein